VLDVAQEVESKPVAKQPRGRPRKRPIEEVEEEEEVEVLENSLSASDNELVDYVARRTRSKRTGSDLLQNTVVRKYRID
jgi:DNA-directed RNA polymerase specialized sigma24 family protein